MMNGVNSMNAAQINNEVQALKLNIYNEIHHRILLENTGIPVLKDEQLFFILLPFLQGKKYDDVMKASVSSVGIVHASLEEHEKIKEQSAEDKEQQLTVLSGDYYSGRYYEILAHTKNISLIYHLSTGIVARCEQQIRLYESHILTVEEWIQYLTVIESELIVQFYHSIQAKQFISIAKQALTIIRLTEVIELLKNGEQSLLITRIHESSTNILELHQQLEAYKQNLRILLRESSLKQELIHWIEDIVWQKEGKVLEKL